MKLINFYSEDIDYTPKQKNKLREWIQSVIEGKQKKLILINYIFTSDNYLFNINQNFLGHNTFTDIITFDQSSDASHVEADIYISIERVRDNAKDLKISVSNELHRVMIHGVLHLIGYNDKSKPERHQMRKLENHYLALRF